MRQFLLLSLAVFTFNCLSFRSGEYKNAPTVSQFKVASKPIIKIDLKYEYRVGGSLEKMQNQALVDAWLKFAEDTLKESGNVQTTREDILATHIFAMTVKEDTDFFSDPISPTLSGFTLGVIPAYIGSDLTLNTVVKDKSGKSLGEVTKSESLTLIGHILLSFANLFVKPSDTIESQRTDLLRATYNEIQVKNIIGSKK
ncbi:hypothetical protein [Leptospira jelokensis]|uniref:hypothetical protein n=1 Tax=Leptospira jelokensis TaxID=2484931 RepID=UPI0010916FA1|nr:hypothetical protein [Leptospira jelokensis]TGM04605.1 hypothetical protein EHQ79_05940 [Leptospira jelokensis]